MYKQDKVNYAVSEKEVGTAGVTTLTGMTGWNDWMGFTWLYWAVLSCPGGRSDPG